MTKDRSNLKADLFASPKTAAYLGGLDTLILDIDGVILDVRESFRRAISLTTQFYFENYLHWPKGPTLIEPEETQAFKLARGFNNDWELTDAVVLFYLVRSIKVGSKDLGLLRAGGGPLSQFVAEIETLGGGIEAATKIVEDDFSRIRDLWQRNIIKQIFQEIYAGVDHCMEIYGFEPSLIRHEGLLSQEKTLIDKDLVAAFYPKVGVITGRTSKEAALALKMASLSELVDPKAIIGDDGGKRKPDPSLLSQLAEYFETKVGAYLGDTADDLEMVNNFKAEGNKATFISCMISVDPLERDHFATGRADIVAPSANDFLREAIRAKKT